MGTVVLYVRVSTDEQAEKGYSQRYQEDALIKHCEINHYRILSVFKEDHSAKTFNRPAWNQIMGILKKGQCPDLLLFTKWDRFSRNTADAYHMIRKLSDWGISPQAIEQPLDLSIPENKMLLAFYLAIPEVENDRRALNIITASRKAKKEGRWMGRAPIGYKNKSSETGFKFIEPQNPEADIIKWAFYEIAQAKYNIRQIWEEAQKRGLKCCSSNFRNLIKNPVYCGKIKIATFQNEQEIIVEGLHQGIISEKLFNAVQEVINSKKRSYKKTYIVPSQLILRGFLFCPLCKRKLSGSASTGRNARYFYYHCRLKCKYRERAGYINEKFFQLLIALNPVEQGWLTIFKKILVEYYKAKFSGFISKQNDAKKQIEILTKKLEKARDLLLTDNLSIEDFGAIRIEYELKIKGLQKTTNNDFGDLHAFKATLVDKVASMLRAYDYYTQADITNKRKIIDCLFKGPLYFDNKGFSYQLRTYIGN